MRDPTYQPPDSVANKDEPYSDVDCASYEIRLACHLTERGVERFDDLEVSYDDEGNTCLLGRFDQAALHGLLNKVRDLNSARTGRPRLTGFDGIQAPTYRSLYTGLKVEP